MESTKRVSPAFIWATYIASCGGIILVFKTFHEDPWTNGLLAHSLATLIVFVSSFTASNTSIYDPFWYLAPVAVAAGWISTSVDGQISLRGSYAFLFLLQWAARFVIQLPWDGWTVGIDREDWRYVDFAKNVTGINTVLYWTMSLIGFHFVPTLLVFGGLQAAQPVWTAGRTTS